MGKKDKYRQLRQEAGGALPDLSPNTGYVDPEKEAFEHEFYSLQRDNKRFQKSEDAGVVHVTENKAFKPMNAEERMRKAREIIQNADKEYTPLHDVAENNKPTSIEGVLSDEEVDEQFSGQGGGFIESMKKRFFGRKKKISKRMLKKAQSGRWEAGLISSPSNDSYRAGVKIWSKEKTGNPDKRKVTPQDLAEARHIKENQGKSYGSMMNFNEENWQQLGVEHGSDLDRYNRSNNDFQTDASLAEEGYLYEQERQLKDTNKKPEVFEKDTNSETKAA